MLFATIGQGSVFGWMLLAGMLTGLLYDFFRLLRFLSGGGTAACLVFDLLWGVCAGIAVAAMLVIANRGVVRAWIPAAVAAGWALYALAASRPALQLIGRIGRIVKKLPRFRLFDIVFK